MSKHNHTSEALNAQIRLDMTLIASVTATVLLVALAFAGCSPANAERVSSEKLRIVKVENTLTDVKSWRYHGDLSKNVLAVKPNRHPLAIFVPKTCLDSQSSRGIRTSPLSQYQNIQGKTVISMVSNLPPSYNGLSLQNKRAFRRICRAVANTTERHTRYPMTFHTVIITQKVLGGRT